MMTARHGCRPDEGDDLVECDTLYGGKRSVPRSTLEFRPGAYAFIYREPRILLVRMRLNGKYCLPGGGIEKGERSLDALRREVKEETGLDVDVGEFLFVRENFHYYDPHAKAWHGFCLCWECTPTTPGFDLDPDAGDDEEGDPRWVDLFSLGPEECHGVTYELIEAFRDKRGLRERPEAG